MKCEFSGTCGGCAFRHLSEPDYRELKLARFRETLARIKQADIPLGTPRFISDGTRRRASLAFTYKKGQLTLGFNVSGSSDLVGLNGCPLLTPALNALLPRLSSLLKEICALPFSSKKGKKIIRQTLAGGDVWLTEAANGIDVVLEFDAEPELPHRLAVCEAAQGWNDVVRVSHRRCVGGVVEPLIEKAKPYVNIGGYAVYIPPATFLQPSVAGEQALTSLVAGCLDAQNTNIADLFCGVGTFSYVLAGRPGVKILAVDSSKELLAGFQESLNRNMLSNVRVLSRNLFKYPLDAKELAGFDAVVFDPPRAGAAAQAAQLAALPVSSRPSQIVAVSCNPQSFVNDANILLAGGWRLAEVTLVDQFIYSNHSELVALFTSA